MMLKTIPVLISTVFFSLIAGFCPAQKANPDSDSQWKQIDNLVSKGLTRSALEGVDKIYLAAKKRGDDVQIIKSLLYRLTLNDNIQEDADVKSIAEAEKETREAKEPTRSILASITAELYWNLFQGMRYKLYNRTNTEGFKKEDIKTWNADDFHKKIGDLYLASIREKKVLQQTTLERFDPVLIKGNVRYLRPTLYDLLAHRALSYFKSDERDINRPAYAFEISDEKAFAPAQEFAKHSFIVKDSASLHYYALAIFQELLLFHAADSKKDALIDADINRIEFVKQYGVMADKDGQYIRALENIRRAFPDNSASANAGYLIAQQIFDKANTTAGVSVDSSVYTMARAKSIADEVIKKFDGSEGAINAKNLLNQILHKEINLTSEKVNVPGKPFRTLVNYRNVPAISIRILKITPGLKAMLEQNDENNNLWKKLTSQNSIRSWKQQLPFTNDYNNHSTEIKIDPLPVGQYALLASAGEDFSLSKNPLAVQYLHVSDISFVNNGQEYFTLDRESGKPLAGARVQVWNQQYNYTTGRYILQKQELLTADKNGYFKIADNSGNKRGQKIAENRNIRLEITYQEDRLFLDDYQSSYRYYGTDVTGDTTALADAESIRKYEKKNTKIFLFTDRSIYRPGQLVYFKGIGVTKKIRTQNSGVLTSKDPITIVLTDADGQKIDSATFLPNEYGSFNGRFRLPENKLNGEFSLVAPGYDDAFMPFSVEEYKRPKFYVDFEKVKGTYRVNDTVKIAGTAKAYVGNNVDNATVKYRVTRVARFLYPWMFWRWPMPVVQPMEITHGEIKTGADGTFFISFKAIPDLTIDKKTDPVFDYKVEVDVSDINGETRSSFAIVPVSYKSLSLQLGLASGGPLNADSLKEIYVTSKNISGEFEPTQAAVRIYKLQAPQRLIRNRFWPQPDRFVLTKEEFLQYFPNDEYSDETKKETWGKTDLVFSKTDSTKPAGSWQLDAGNWQQGWYVVEASAKDRFGDTVMDVKYFELYDPKTPQLPSPVYAWDAAIKNNVEPGKEAAFISGSAASDIFLIQQTDKGDQDRGSIDSRYQFLTLDKSKKTFQFPVTGQDRGGFAVYRFFVKDNRVYTATWDIQVPWTNKQLDISFETFRDKTLPGSEEKWKVRISGKKGEKAAAEMLAGMYDASLDQFKPHSWAVPDIWPNHFTYNGWASAQNFTSVRSMEKWVDEEYQQQKEKRYDALLSVGRTSGGLMTREFMRDNVLAAPQNQEVVVTVLGRRVSGTAPPGMAKAEAISLELDSAAVAPVPDRAPVDASQVQIRKNFNETAFFFPELRTDKEGNVEFSFTMPEALTRWKLLALAHTRELATGYGEKTVITRKDLMVQPNAPRFVREGDRIDFSAKIVNAGVIPVSGNAELQLFNASTMNPVDSGFKNNIRQRSFTIPAGQSAAVKFSMHIPVNYDNALVYRIIAKASSAGGASDGEEAAIPVLTNRMLVTETLPLPMKKNETKNFTFDHLLHSGGSASLSNHALTVEFTANPAWYAVQALPYLMEYPYDCAEQTFNRYYANSIAGKIVSASPKIKAVFEKWKIADTSALLSNLQKNEELKSVLLQETPWVLQAQNESVQKKNIALLFDMARMAKELESSLSKLKEMQSPNGGFVWFKGGPDDRYMTQYIITGVGHMKKLGVFTAAQDQKLLPLVNAAIFYLDKKMKSDYDHLMKYSTAKSKGAISPDAMVIQYLYMRSFFPDHPVAAENQVAYDYYRSQAKKSWLSQSKYMQAMTALVLYRLHDRSTPAAIIRSLKENSITNEETGRYWKEWNAGGYWWYRAPIESQAMMIEAFGEIDGDQAIINDLKTWLLKNKQTNNWHTTKATAEACYALLLQGSNWLDAEKNVVIKAGDIIINSKEEAQQTGTGYFKTKIDGNRVNSGMGNISVTVTPQNAAAETMPVVSWGAVYWQYFEDLDKITFAETPLKLNKKLFIETNTDRGPVLTPVSAEAGKVPVKVGDKIKVRIELRVDRDMEYVHMKDMRASAMEPANVISAYKYQDGLGYYETTKDASTNFFFNWLSKGTYVFEYTLFVTHSGDFSNGITTIQCMYAPEFTAHSEGTRVDIKE